MSNQALKTALQEGQVTVTFIKADGTDRVMTCTTNFDLIPVEKHPKETPAVEVDPNVPPRVSSAARVYEAAKGEWRSFRWDSVRLWSVIGPAGLAS